MIQNGVRNIIKSNIPWQFKALLSEQATRQLKSASSVALAMLASAGIISLSAVAPNVISAIGHFTLQRKYPKRRSAFENPAKKTAETFYYLKRSGLIRVKAQKNDLIITLTRLGRKKADELKFESLFIPKTKNWNKKWWLVAGDIPTRDHRWGADMLRKKLKDLNFYPLQRTLWVYPHDPKRELQFILDRFSIQNFVTLMEVSRLDKEDEKKVKKFFRNLKII